MGRDVARAPSDRASRPARGTRVDAGTRGAVSTRGGTRTRNALASARLLRPLTLPVCPPGPGPLIVERSSDSAEAPTTVQGGSSVARNVIQPGARPPASRPVTRALLRMCPGDGRAVARHRRLD